MSNLCIIPARGGSKRIPRKNIKDFLGKPIIAYSIEIALQSGLFDEVMVSTDDDEIAQVAKNFGASVPFMRSKENADDYATLADVIDEVKRGYINAKKVFENICCILPTAPFVQIHNVIQSYQKLVDSRFDSIRPIVKYGYPIQRAIKMSKDGEVSFFYPKFTKSRSQDLENSYHDAGQFYWMKFSNGMHSSSRGAIIIPEKFVQDIDTEEDWELAEIKYSILLKKSLI